jgi:fluoride ion exporter CrcB/FEX
MKIRTVAIVVAALAVIVVARLSQHLAGQPFSWEALFSRENIVEVLIINVIAAFLIGALIFLWKR